MKTYRVVQVDANGPINDRKRTPVATGLTEDEAINRRAELKGQLPTGGSDWYEIEAE